MNSRKSNVEAMKIDLDFSVATERMNCSSNFDFIIYVSKLIEKSLDDVIEVVENEKMNCDFDMSKIKVSLEVIKILVTEIHFKLPESIANGELFGSIPIFEDEKARLEHLYKVLTLVL